MFHWPVFVVIFSLTSICGDICTDQYLWWHFYWLWWYFHCPVSVVIYALTIICGDICIYQYLWWYLHWRVSVAILYSFLPKTEFKFLPIFAERPLDFRGFTTDMSNKKLQKVSKRFVKLNPDWHTTCCIQLQVTDGKCRREFLALDSFNKEYNAKRTRVQIQNTCTYFLVPTLSYISQGKANQDFWKAFSTTRTILHFSSIDLRLCMTRSGWRHRTSE
jgi:hypothetical protein